ncbi:MAG: DNA-3-methyladenine glycosylase 2 family protein [Burkholderiales bacterium]|nr:DNA-3-methyladenine glycosylase 2 family protein [Burkholderiales bacterium]
MPATLACTIALPKQLHLPYFMAFHRRDTQEVSESVSDTVIRKGLLWAGQPACLTVALDDTHAKATLDVDDAVEPTDAQKLENMVRRMFGVDQPVEAFEAAHRKHPTLGRLIKQQAGLRVPVAATPFEALVWAITGQQISVAAAISIRRKMILTVGIRHSGGLYCHPEAANLAALSDAEWRQAGFSVAKIKSIRLVTQQVLDGALPLDTWADAPPVSEIETRLNSISGIGPWTISYTLLRGFGWLDGSLHGDVAVRKKLQMLLGSETPLDQAQTKAWLAEFSPWRALVAAHLWAM